MTTVGQHPDLAAEQAYIDRAYDRLDTMRADAATALQAALAHGRGGGTYQTLVERDVLVANSVQRLSRLEIGDEALCFGRIDRETGESFHIGRLAVWNEEHDPLVIDWRAPAAEPFYRATGRHPLGLVRRRHFLAEGRHLVGIEDEVFGEGADGLGLAGSSALRAALERARTGRMRDIVATVQHEQDEIIRAPLTGVLVVQGGPGTGKTAVALHRAAYLLYTHRFPLERQGVLVVGPNRLFMRYIEHVLPSLGESGVSLSTIAGLVPHLTVRGEDTDGAARLKGDPRMAKVLAQAVRDRQRPLRSGLEVGFGSFVLRLSPEDTEQLVRQARRRPGPHNGRRPVVERLLFERLHQRYLAARDRNERAGLRPAPDTTDPLGGESPAPAPPDQQVTVADVKRALRREPAIVEALERMWPVLTPAQLLRDLFGAPSLVALAAGRLLGDDERRQLLRPRGTGVDDVAWTVADAALLDEAAALLGPARRRSPEETADDGPDRVRTFGHIVVDEAQDLTPMQLRMLGRRSLSGSMTLVGDVAQATGMWAPEDWKEVLAHLPTRRGARVVELTVNYRTPSEIMDVAARVLEAAIPGARLPDSVRSTGEGPRVVRAGGEASLAATVAATVRDEQARIGDGMVAVIHPPSLRDELAAALRRDGIETEDPAVAALDSPVTLVPVESAKGLEFDAVVVVEPARLVREARNGLKALFVALTRATRRLAIVHDEDLPPVLGL